MPTTKQAKQDDHVLRYSLNYFSKDGDKNRRWVNTRVMSNVTVLAMKM